MALQVGQKRNIDYGENNFRTEVSINTSTVGSRNIFGDTSTWRYNENYFQDYGFILDSCFSTSNVYYLTLAIQRQTNQIHFDIKLQTDVDKYAKEDPSQILKSCTLNAKIVDENNPEAGKYDYYDLVFVPNRKDYKVLVLCINRDANDILVSPTPALSASTFSLYSLENLVNSSEEKYWKKMGIQSRPGSLIVVNKEPIRIGRSGIYQLNNGTKVTNVMIASGWEKDQSGQTIDASVDPFLIDYVYQTNESEEQSI